MDGRKKPVRTCVACRQSRDKSELVRVVKTPEGGAVVDVSGRMNGRGAYICKSPECVELARKKRALSRTFKTDVGADIYDRLRETLE